MRSALWLVWMIGCLIACTGGGQSPPFDAAVDASVIDGPVFEVGRLCESSAMQTDPTLLATPSLDCESRLCLHVEGRTDDRCTAQCRVTEDCVEDVAAVPCTMGYTCTLVISSGPFACQSMCVCRDVIPAGGFPVGCD